MEPHQQEAPVADSLLRLAPHLVGRARRGIVGDSRYALTLREAVRTASQDPRGGPLLISGEPGLEKDNIAALIHFGSPARRQLMVRLDGALLRGDGAELFGAAGRTPAVLCDPRKHFLFSRPTTGLLVVSRTHPPIHLITTP